MHALQSLLKNLNKTHWMKMLNQRFSNKIKKYHSKHYFIKVFE